MLVWELCMCRTVVTLFCDPSYVTPLVVTPLLWPVFCDSFLWPLICECDPSYVTPFLWPVLCNPSYVTPFMWPLSLILLVTPLVTPLLWPPFLWPPFLWPSYVTPFTLLRPFGSHMLIILLLSCSFQFPTMQQLGQELIHVLEQLRYGKWIKK